MKSGFLVFSLVLSSVTAWMTATAKRDVAQQIVRDMTSAFDRMDDHGYTISDALTRFQDVLHVVDAVIGLVRDIPYTVIIWCGTVWYLVSRQPTVAEVLLGVLIIILLLLTPFVRRVRNVLYPIRLRMSQLNNRFTAPTNDLGAAVQSAWRDLTATIYRQALWSIPMTATV